jgi:hypothetical protein
VETVNTEHSESLKSRTILLILHYYPRRITKVGYFEAISSSAGGYYRYSVKTPNVTQLYSQCRLSAQILLPLRIFYQFIPSLNTPPHQEYYFIHQSFSCLLVNLSAFITTSCVLVFLVILRICAVFRRVRKISKRDY